LISHEYFHTWNVKRLKPAEFEALDHDQENYTELLWFFEGFTSYYDDLFLLRSGLIDAPRYLKLLSSTVSGVLAAPGRKVQSLAQASYEAWIKYYRPDENTPNATVSYYAKGALLALALDLSLRSGMTRTAQPGCSLDDVMRGLWLRSGGAAITEADVLEVVAALGGPELAGQLRTAPMSCRCRCCVSRSACSGAARLPAWRSVWACGSRSRAAKCWSSRCCKARPRCAPAWPRVTKSWPAMTGGCGGLTRLC
jgi:predicted metalloprotease with PDZ domain